MDDPSILWRATREPVQDPMWNVYKYEDGAIQFVCDKCQKSVWQGRDVIQKQIEDYMMQAHMTQDNKNIFCAASKNHGHEPDYYNIYDVSEKNIENVNDVLWVALSGWSIAKDGPPIEPDIQMDLFELIKISSINPDRTQNKSVDEYIFDDILNEGISSLNNTN